jgi:Mlc titration factor MtfA (ptsG expression regulator)
MAGDGYNVVIHEFAHKLDMRNGEANGMPPLPPGMSAAEWQQVLLASYDAFCAAVDEPTAAARKPPSTPTPPRTPASSLPS